ncbi:uncharacterized protein RHO17_026169 [Thomomys bottae]
MVVDGERLPAGTRHALCLCLARFPAHAHALIHTRAHTPAPHAPRGPPPPPPPEACASPAGPHPRAPRPSPGTGVVSFSRLPLLLRGSRGGGGAGAPRGPRSLAAQGEERVGGGRVWKPGSGAGGVDPPHAPRAPAAAREDPPAPPGLACRRWGCARDSAPRCSKSSSATRQPGSPERRGPEWIRSQMVRRIYKFESPHSTGRD